MNTSRFQAIIDQHRITIGVVLALTVASLLTLVSMALYISSGASLLDLSRPGFEQARSEVAGGDELQEFSPTGPVTSAVLKDFQARFTAQQKELNELGDFSSSALDDDELQLTPRSERQQ